MLGWWGLFAAVATRNFTHTPFLCEIMSSLQTHCGKLDTIRGYCDNLSEDDIIAACSNPKSQRPGKHHHCNRVIKLNEDIVVKYGYGVREEEAHNIQKVYELVDQSVVRTPRLFRYFRRASSGYILMEFIDGVVAEDVDESLALKTMISILQHFKSVTGYKPGPLGGGWSRGLMWEDQEAHFHGSITIMEKWYNRRLIRPGTLSFADETLVLCHLDLSRRNIILPQNNSNPPAVVDWMSAGFYPRSFELYMLSLQHELVEGDFYKILLERLSVSPATQQQIELISEVWSNAKKFHL
jgi:thiamine kinase-like enzyme